MSIYFEKEESTKKDIFPKNFKSSLAGIFTQNKIISRESLMKINEMVSDLGFRFDMITELSFKEVHTLISKCDDIITKHDIKSTDLDEFFDRVEDDAFIDRIIVDLNKNGDNIIAVLIPHTFHTIPITSNDILLYAGESRKEVDYMIKCRRKNNYTIIGYINIWMSLRDMRRL